MTYNCEFCGNTHDGSYGSGRFCSDNCRRRWCGRQSNKNGKLTGHIGCNKYTANKSSDVTMKRCTSVKRTDVHGSGQPLAERPCQYCGRPFTFRCHLIRHEKECNSNPNRIPRKTHARSDEAKRKTSETMKKFCAEHPDRVPYVLNHHRRGDSYPEMFFKNVLDSATITYDKDFPACGYFLDFAWPNAKAYFEVDGEQHYVDKRIVEHDVERTAKLDADGWKCLTRIRWSTFQKSTKEEQQKIIQDLISLINNATMV